jgi:osmotically-inducible protein OsmY
MAIAVLPGAVRITMNRSFQSLLHGFVLSGALPAPAAINAAQSHAPDNTAVNKQDRDRRRPTADQAKNNKSDRNLTKQIRRDVVQDKSLSTYAHNVRTIADSAKVTLRGPVHSEDEKRAVDRIGAQIRGPWQRGQ